LATASSDAAPVEISNAKFVLQTPKARVRSWTLAAVSAERFKLSWAWVLECVLSPQLFFLIPRTIFLHHFLFFSVDLKNEKRPSFGGAPITKFWGGDPQREKIQQEY